MIKFDLDLQGIYSCNVSYFGKEQVKKELQGNDYLMLYGALAIMCTNNAELLEMYNLTTEQVLNDASICDNALHLNGFEGYQLSDRLNLHSLILNKYNCVCVRVYDNKFDRLIDFVM